MTSESRERILKALLGKAADELDTQLTRIAAGDILSPAETAEPLHITVTLEPWLFPSEPQDGD